MDVEIEDRSYYHGRITRDDAVRLLQDRGRDGSFLLRMSTTQDGVYTLSVMQGSAVRHIRVINKHDGYALSQADPGEDSVWDLIEKHRHSTLTNTYDSYDAVSLRYPLPADAEPIAPDLLMVAGEAGMDAADFNEEAAAFLEGGVNTKELVRRRSSKRGNFKHRKEDLVRKALGPQGEDPDLERFMNGRISAQELTRRRSVKGPGPGAIVEETAEDDELGGIDLDNIPEGYFPDDIGLDLEGLQ